MKCRIFRKPKVVISPDPLDENEADIEEPVDESIVPEVVREPAPEEALPEQQLPEATIFPEIIEADVAHEDECVTERLDLLTELAANILGDLRDQNEALLHWREKDQLISTQAKRIQELSDGSIESSILKPILQILIGLNDVLESAATMDEGADASGTLSALQAAQSDLGEVFQLCGVSVINAESSKFDPSLQRAISIEEETAPEDGVVLETIRTGYKWKGEILRYQDVSIRRVKQQPSLATSK